MNYGVGAYPWVGDVSVIDNLQMVNVGPCWAAPVQIGSGDGESAAAYRYDYTFRGNKFISRGNAFELWGIQNVDVSSNSVSFTLPTDCGGGVGVQLFDSHTVAITNNSFSGANSVYSTDTLWPSTGIFSENNTLD